MEVYALGPCLLMNKILSTTAMNESKFIHRNAQAPQLQQPCLIEQIVREGSQETSFWTPYRNTLGGRKKRMGGTSRSIAFNHTWKKSVTSRQATKNVPAKHQTHSPRGTPHGPTLQLKPNQPEPKNETPNINDPIVGSPMVTLLWLILPVNDKVQWTSHDLDDNEPPSSTQFEHFTGSFNQ